MMLREHLLWWRRVRLKEYRRWVPCGCLMSGPKFVLKHYHLLYRGQNRPWQQSESRTFALAFQGEHTQNDLAFCGIAQSLCFSFVSFCRLATGTTGFAFRCRTAIRLARTNCFWIGNRLARMLFAARFSRFTAS